MEIVTQLKENHQITWKRQIQLKKVYSAKEVCNFFETKHSFLFRQVNIKETVNCIVKYEFSWERS